MTFRRYRVHLIWTMTQTVNTDKLNIKKERKVDFVRASDPNRNHHLNIHIASGIPIRLFSTQLENWFAFLRAGSERWQRNRVTEFILDYCCCRAHDKWSCWIPMWAMCDRTIMCMCVLAARHIHTHADQMLYRMNAYFLRLNKINLHRFLRRD